MRSNKTLRYFYTFINKSPNITGRERFVLSKRVRSITHTEIGLRLNLTEGRIRQIEKRAISKIKSKIKQLNLFIRG